MYNSVTLIGHLGQQPETKVLNSGGSVTRLSLATSRSWKNDAGEKQEETQWHNVILWNKLGELAQQYLDKGSKVLIVGRIAYRTAEVDGEKKYYTDIVATEMKFLDSSAKRDNRFPEDAPATLVATPTPAAKQPTAAAADDLPF